MEIKVHFSLLPDFELITTHSHIFLPPYWAVSLHCGLNKPFIPYVAPVVYLVRTISSTTSTPKTQKTQIETLLVCSFLKSSTLYSVFQVAVSVT